jgi:hypothetical protein
MSNAQFRTLAPCVRRSAAYSWGQSVVGLAKYHNPLGFRLPKLSMQRTSRSKPQSQTHYKSLISDGLVQSPPGSGFLGTAVQHNHVTSNSDTSRWTPTPPHARTLARRRRTLHTLQCTAAFVAAAGLGPEQPFHHDVRRSPRLLLPAAAAALGRAPAPFAVAPFESAKGPAAGYRHFRDRLPRVYSAAATAIAIGRLKSPGLSSRRSSLTTCFTSPSRIAR